MKLGKYNGHSITFNRLFIGFCPIEVKVVEFDYFRK